MAVRAPEADAFIGRSVASESRPGVYFLLDRRLGVGGTAAAYLSTRIAPEGRSLAVVKIILPEIAASHGSTAAMVVQKESVALGRLNEKVPPTPFVVRLMDVGSIPYNHRGQDVALPWLAIEYVDGGIEGATLEERMVQSLDLTRRAFDRERAARAIGHIASGLADVHSVGVIHRDLTPNNVLCCGFGDSELFKLSDFGIARPAGMIDTFGPSAVGTPGYMPPEQLKDSNTTPAADIFSFGCLMFFILTGEHLFDVQNPLEMLARSGEERRRSIRESATVCEELRNDTQACETIDALIQRATAADPTRRPQSSREIATVLVPLLLERASYRARRQRATRMSETRLPLIAQLSWLVKHPPGDTRIVRSVGWDGDGHCLAATSEGLEYWNGTDWKPAPARDLPFTREARFVRRVAPGRWLVGGDQAQLAEYSHSGVSRVIRGRDAETTFVDASGSVSDLAVIVAARSDQTLELCAVVGGRWLKPLPLADAAYVAGLTAIDEERWLLVGRARTGGGFAAIYSPLSWSLESLAAPPTRAWVACCAQPERDVVIAVGTEGAVLRIERGVAAGQLVSGRPNLASVAVDVLDREWTGAAGALFCSVAAGEWSRVFDDPSWDRPFVSIFADVSTVVAMTVDGGIIECRPSQRPASLG